MKKLIEIEFNHELIGKEGIVIKYRNGKEIGDIYLSAAKMKLRRDYPILSIDESGDSVWHALNGIYRADTSPHPLDLIMFEEIEVKEPRVIWVSFDELGKISETSRSSSGVKKWSRFKPVKFIEVIEEGE